MYNSLCYVVCCNIQCKESGNIKKNLIKCSECKKHLTNLTLDVLNKHFCPHGSISKCSNIIEKCNMLHPTKHHHSPPYISPCINGKHCINKKCLFLHPNKYIWLYII